MATNETMTGLEPSIWRNNGVCENCGEVVDEGDLLPCYGSDGIKDYACPNCGTAHYLKD